MPRRQNGTEEIAHVKPSATSRQFSTNSHFSLHRLHLPMLLKPTSICHLKIRSQALLQHPRRRKVPGVCCLLPSPLFRSHSWSVRTSDYKRVLFRVKHYHSFLTFSSFKKIRKRPGHPSHGLALQALLTRMHPRNKKFLYTSHVTTNFVLACSNNANPCEEVSPWNSSTTSFR